MRVAEYVALRRSSGYRTLRARRGLEPLMGFLAAQGLLPVGQANAPRTATEQLLARFGRYLLEERGLAASTVGLYQKRARRFLTRCAPGGDVEEVTAGDVTAAVLAECTTVAVGSAQYFVAALRSFLRFCYLERLTQVDLSVAALAVTGRRPSLLPEGMSAAPIQGVGYMAVSSIVRRACQRAAIPPVGATVCVMHWPWTWWPPGRRCLRSGRSCDITPSRRRPSTPEWTSNGYA